MIRDTSGQDREVRGTRDHRRKWMIGAGIGLLVLVPLLYSPVLSRLYSADLALSETKLRMATVIRGDLLRDVSSQGKVVSANSPTLYAPAAGVVSLKVKAGDKVSRHTVLAVIDSPGLKSRYDQERAKLDELQIEVSRQVIQSRTAQLEVRQKVAMAKVDLDVADRAYARAELGAEKQIISRVDVEQAKVSRQKAELVHRQAAQNSDLGQDSAQFELKVKQLQLNRQKLLVDDLARQVDDLNLRAPIDGVVGSVNVREKDTVAASAPLITVVDLSSFEIEADVPEVYVDDIAAGLPTIIEFNGTSHKGTLVAISPEVVSGKVSVRIRFDEGTPKGVRQNQRVSTTIIIESKRNVLKVQRGDFVETGGGRFTYLVTDNLARRQPITLGARGTGEVEVLSGLQEGQKIVISSLDELGSKDTVYITD